MLVIGLIREGKVPVDNRVALTPAQCKWLHRHFSDIKIIAQTSPVRCYKDAEYEQAGVKVSDDLSECNLLLGIKEVPVDLLIESKSYMFFSHTRKRQPHNARMLGRMMELNEQLMDAKMEDDEQTIDKVKKLLNGLQTEIYSPVKNIIENYQDSNTTKEELLQVKEYYFKKKYLSRILAGIN